LVTGNKADNQKKLKDKGWKQNSGYAQLGNPRVLERNKVRISIIKPIKIDPFKQLGPEIDKFFRSLIKIIEKNRIKDVFYPSGGTIPLPQFFLDYCRENGINIHGVTLDTLDQAENRVD
jgi:hypothetical protein